MTSKIQLKALFTDLKKEREASIVPYEYPAKIKDWNGIMLVGEAPGKEEDLQKRPFVGRSGKLLDETLVKSGIVRENSLVANVFRVRPPKNKVDHFFSSRRAAQNASLELSEEMGRFGSTWLLSENMPDIIALQELIKEKSPKLIMALGRTPFWALTGQNGLLKAVGKRFDCRLAPGFDVMPTFHPSYILRGNWGLQPEWIKHFSAAAQ